MIVSNLKIFPGENGTDFKWLISGFQPEDLERERWLCSPSLFFAGWSWRLDCKREYQHSSSDVVVLRLCRSVVPPSPAPVVRYWLGAVRGCRGQEEEEIARGRREPVSSPVYHSWLPFSELQRRIECFAPSGTLSFFIRFRSGPETVASSLQVLHIQNQEKDDNRQLTELLNHLRQDMEVGDIRLKCRDNKSLRAHSFMLSWKSPLFRDFINQSNMEVHDSVKEGQKGIYELQVDFDKEVVDEVLNFIYLQSTSPSNIDVACNLYVAAERFSLKGLKDTCWTFLCSKVNKDHYIECLRALQKYECQDFKQLVFRFVCENRDVLKGEDWLEFIKSKGIVAHLLQQIATTPF